MADTDNARNLDGWIRAEVEGIPVEIDASALADFDVLETFAAVAEGDDGAFLRFPWLARRIFGAAQWEEIKKTHRAANGGRFSVLDASGIITSALNSIAAGGGEAAKNC